MRTAASLSLFCLILVLGGAMAQGRDDDLEARIAAATRKMASTDINVNFEAWGDLGRIGAPAAPALAALLQDEHFEPKWEVIVLLGNLGRREYIPLLKRFADAAPQATYSFHDLNAGGPASLAAWAHGAIVQIICPASKGWPGSDVGSADQGEPGARNYHRRMEAAYREWAATYPATSTSTSAAASRAASSPNATARPDLGAAVQSVGRAYLPDAHANRLGTPRRAGMPDLPTAGALQIVPFMEESWSMDIDTTAGAGPWHLASGNDAKTAWSAPPDGMTAAPVTVTVTPSNWITQTYEEGGDTTQTY
jgi:hypothetical protein